jgi:hypothetical protein
VNKYGFRIRTRSGGTVDNLQVQANDRAEAEAKIGQIYRNCEILECHEVTPTLKKEGLDLEDVIALINRQDRAGDVTLPGGPPAPDKDKTEG